MQLPLIMYLLLNAKITKNLALKVNILLSFYTFTVVCYKIIR